MTPDRMNRKKDNPPARTRGRVLIIDDEAAMGHILSKSLRLDGFEVLTHTDPMEGFAAIAKEQPDVILTDVRMPGMTGMQLLEQIKGEHPEIPVLLMTAFGTVEDAVRALKAGAFNFITKPFQHESLVHQIELALDRRHLEQENIRLSEGTYEEEDGQRLIGSSVEIGRVRELILRAAQTDSAVLITGESGVGKELVARAIHRLSRRHEQHFVAVNCPAIPPTLIESELFGYERGAFTGADRTKMGLIELSAGGTLFLDEIAEIPSEIQVKLLRVLQEHEVQRVGGLKQIPVNIRVVSATNRVLDEEIAARRFRTDLYYRLNVIPIVVPPLRERSVDIEDLASHFLAVWGRKNHRPGIRLGDDMIEIFRSYDWPGNIRELANTLEAVSVMAQGDVITKEDLPPGFLHGGRTRIGQAKNGDGPDADKVQWPVEYKEARREFEQAYLNQLLSRCGGNVAQAARTSGVSRRSLYEKFDRYGMNKGNSE